MDRDVSGARIDLQPVQHGQTGGIGQPDVEQNRARQELRRQDQCLVGRRRDQYLKSLFMRQLV